ncbi:MAG: 16S rRNA (uracil(1498)-N(3))-methyltransferase [Aureispira sp.]|nr:16S rRNA (uracil(1498)-N(3))-methyltransferase [Aureispira sp.]
MQLFYASINQGYAILTEDEMRHCTKTLRKKVGDTIVVMDGKGAWFEVVLDQISKRQVLCKIVKEVPLAPSPNYTIHIAIAPTKNIDRLEFFLEKATEMGIGKVSLLLCQRSERRKVRVDRLQRILLSAAKQSLKAHLPIVTELISFRKFISNCGDQQKLIAHCLEGTQSLSKTYQKEQDVCILIGPEGDFSPEEIDWALEHGFKPISLGKSRLRTETAGIVACHSIHLLNNL